MVMRIIVCPAALPRCTPATCLAQALEADNTFANNACWRDTDEAKKGAWGELLRMLQQACDDDVEIRKTVTYASVHSVLIRLRAVKKESSTPEWLTCPAARDSNKEEDKKRGAGGGAVEAMKSKKVARRN